MSSETPQQDATKFKLNTSKYDFVKVTVWLQDHYYILSRFIVSRMLTVAQVHYKDAIRIALDLKKRLVDEGMLEIQQQDLETLLFEIMRSHGYTEDNDDDEEEEQGQKSVQQQQQVSERGAGIGSRCIYRYKMMTRFHHKRIPLMVLLFGTGCIGKSTLATMLGERLHLPNVLQTDIVWDLHSTMARGAPCQPVWLRRFDTREAFLEEYRRECATVRRALEGDIAKCFKDGKPIIIEGSHLDPSLMRELFEDVNLASAASDDSGASGSGDSGDGDDSGNRASRCIQKKGIVVPVFLSMRREEHLLFIEQWLASRHERLDLGTSEHLTFEQKLRTLQDNFCAMDDYLLQQIRSPASRNHQQQSTSDLAVVPTAVGSQPSSASTTSSTLSYENGIHKVEVNLHRVERTVEELHTAVLERIELAFKEGAF